MKDYTYVTLMDIYGNALTAKQKSILCDYYERDYSLSEIADNLGVTRQAVHYSIKQAEESLNDCESKFKLYGFLIKLRKSIDELKNLCGETAADKIADLEELIRSNYGTVR